MDKPSSPTRRNRSTKKAVPGAPAFTAKVPDGAVKTTGIVTEELRHRMIETAAYFLAEGRGFAPGYELSDWLDAEAVIDAELSGEEPAARH